MRTREHPWTPRAWAQHDTRRSPQFNGPVCARLPPRPPPPPPAPGPPLTPPPAPPSGPRGRRLRSRTSPGMASSHNRPRTGWRGGQEAGVITQDALLRWRGCGDGRGLVSAAIRGVCISFANEKLWVRNLLAVSVDDPTCRGLAVLRARHRQGVRLRHGVAPCAKPGGASKTVRPTLHRKWYSRWGCRLTTSGIERAIQLAHVP